MVSAFFGQGFAEASRKQEALDIQQGQLGVAQDRLGLLRDQLQQKAEQNKFSRISEVVKDAQGKLDQITTLVNSRDPQAQAVGRSLLKNIGPQLQNVIRSGMATMRGTSADVPVAGIPTIKEEPVRTVQSRTPSGEQKTQLFRGENPVATVGQGPTVQYQPQTAPKATSKEAADLDAAEVATRTAIENVFELKKLIKRGGPESLGVAGEVSLGIENLRSTVEGVANVLGVNVQKFEDGSAVLNADKKAEGIFERMGIAATLNAQVKSDIVNLAFAAAAASGQSGRGVSDKDFERFVRELGTGAKNPEIFNQVLDRFTDRLNRNFKNRYTVAARRRKDLSGTPPDILNEIKSKQSPVSAVSEMSLDELKQFAEEIKTGKKKATQDEIQEARRRYLELLNQQSQ